MKNFFNVFPTHVGVNLELEQVPAYKASLPHTRGGEPIHGNSDLIPDESSPHTWG